MKKRQELLARLQNIATIRNFTIPEVIALLGNLIPVEELEVFLNILERQKLDERPR